MPLCSPYFIRVFGKEYVSDFSSDGSENESNARRSARPQVMATRHAMIPDDDFREKPKRSKKKKFLDNRGAKTCPGCGDPIPGGSVTCPYCDYAFPIKIEEDISARDKFCFDPDREEDGTLRIEKILGRRSLKLKESNSIMVKRASRYAIFTFKVIIN